MLLILRDDEANIQFKTYRIVSTVCHSHIYDDSIVSVKLNSSVKKCVCVYLIINPACMQDWWIDTKIERADVSKS